MPSDKFRHQLRQEAEQWLSEGLIDPSIYKQLADRYQFSELESAARKRFIAILLVLGSLLLGLGIITFVAANWQVWPRELKVLLLLGMFVGFNTAGFYLWRRQNKGWQSLLGQGLLLVGALALGANMALMSQMFHKSEPIYQFYLVWGLGVLMMAYTLRLTWLGMLAVFLISMGYLRGQGQPEFLVFGELYWLRLMVQNMPVVAALLFIPLAYRCHSRWIFRCGAIAVVYSLEAILIRLNLLAAPAWIAAIACTLPPALLWGYRDSLWGERASATQLFEGTARNLAIAFLSLLFFLLSFYGMWNTSFMPSTRDASVLPGYVLVDLLILGSFTIWEWQRLLRSLDFNNILVAIAIAISGLVPYWHLRTGTLGIVAVLIFNLLLFLLAISLIRQGLALVERRFFWGGMVLLSLQIFSRMREYNTDLLFKSLVLLFCGCGIIAAGLWFEHYVRSKS
ncbi:MAG TPA: DUF2157 domain-containing protein [Cyanobacteria bacterium UBA8803]|nr:DUF2157 domain-containing protein [Cyanobacteria bacterium UBA9273]HBL59614.1 DUF2157 domain-containing protein [Cyanobacteria bacterium UBA8803]